MKPSLVFFSCLWLFLQSGLPLIGQDTWLRDSTYIDIGIEGTSDFENSIRTYFEEHNQNGQALEIISQMQNGQGVWENWRRRTFAYDGFRPSLILIQYWNTTTEEWEEAIKRTYTYNGMGNILLKILQEAPAQGMPLENNKMWTYSYDGSGNQTQMLFQEWQGADWENTSRQTWNYNTDSQIEQQLLELWSGSEWIGSQRRQWDFDGNSNQVEAVTTQVYSTVNDEWVNIERMEYSNAGQAFWTGAKHMIWNEFSETWDNMERELFEYNSEAQLEYRTYQEWSYGEWQNYYRLSYSTAGNTLTALGETWDEGNTNWNDYSRFYAELEDFSRPILEQGWQYLNSATQTWENETITQRRTYFWSQQSVATTETVKAQGCFIPNPYQPFTSFVCEELSVGQPVEMQLFSITGSQLLQQKISGQGPHSLDISIPDGIYVLRIHDRGALIHLQKLVITH